MTFQKTLKEVENELMIMDALEDNLGPLYDSTNWKSKFFM